ncbi:MAG: hypothetical protein BWY76_02622 [bacterium ADurb.Bin429]|nr:MAG: hypothetical protein BWY76_02622 [bacterium ADurb.Bin429]
MTHAALQHVFHDGLRHRGGAMPGEVHAHARPPAGGAEAGVLHFGDLAQQPTVIAVGGAVGQRAQACRHVNERGDAQRAGQRDRGGETWKDRLRECLGHPVPLFALQQRHQPGVGGIANRPPGHSVIRSAFRFHHQQLQFAPQQCRLPVIQRRLIDLRHQFHQLLLRVRRRRLAFQRERNQRPA